MAPRSTREPSRWGARSSASGLVFDGFNGSGSNGPTQTITLAGTSTLTLVGSADANSPNITFNFPTRTIDGNNVPSNVGVINAEIDDNLSVVSPGNPAIPGDLTINVTGTVSAGFGNTSLKLFGTNSFANLNIGGGIQGPASAAPANLVSVSNLPAGANVNFTGHGASFAADTTTGLAVVVSANNFVINSAGLPFDPLNPAAHPFTAHIGATTANEVDVNGVISGNGDLMFSAGFSGGGGTVILNNHNTYTGSTIFNAGGTGTPGNGSGLVQLGIDNALPTGTKLIWGFNTTGNGGTFDLNGHDQEVASVFTPFAAGPDSKLTNNADSGTATLTIGGSDSPGAFSLPITDGDSGAKIALVRSGTGTTILSNVNNSYSGGTTLLGGTLSVDADFELGAPNAAGNNLVLNGGTLAVTGAGFTLSSNRAVLLGPSDSSDGSGAFNVAASGNLIYNGAVADNGSGHGGLTLTGSGTVTLGGTNTYTGPTLINNGNLALTGSLHSSSAVTIAPYAILSGTGAANGPVTVGGTIAPGSASAVGKLTVGSLSLSAGGSYTWKLADAIAAAGVGADLVSVANGTGTLTLDSTPASPFTIDVLAVPGGVSNFDSTQSYSWKIVDAGALAGTPFNTNLFSVNSSGFGAGGPGSSITLSSTANSLFLNYTPGEVLVWIGGSGNWAATVGTSWSGTQWNSGKSADFNTGSGTVTLQTPITATGLEFDVGGYTIAGGGANKLTLALGNGAGSASIAVTNSSDSDTIDAEITGSAPLSKSGAGTLILSGPNSFSGTLTVASGTLQAAAASLPTDIVVNGSLVFDQAVDGAYSHNLSGAGAIVKRNSGTLSLGGTNTGFNGPITIKAGAIGIDSDARLGAATLTLTTGGTLRALADMTTTPITRTIDVGDGLTTTTGSLDTNGFHVILAGTAGQVVLTQASTFIKKGPGDLEIKSGGFTHPSGLNIGTVEVDAGSLTVGNPTDTNSNPKAFFGPTGFPTNLVLKDGSSFVIAASTTANSSLNSLNSLTASGNVKIVLDRTTGGNALSMSPALTTNGSTNTPLTLNGTLTIDATGNISGNTPRVTFGALTLTGDSVFQLMSNPTFSTNFTIQNNLFIDNGHSATFYGQGSATQLAGSGIRINAGGGTSVVTGNWTIGSPDGTQGVVLSIGAADNTSFTTGNITVNPYAQLMWFKNNFTFGTVGQTLTLNGIGNELADFSAGTDGALEIPTGNVNTYIGNVVLGSDSIITPAGTGALTLTGTITDATLGVGQLQKAGQGNLIVLSSANTAPVDVLVGNGTITVGDGNSVGDGHALLPAGDLTLGETSKTSGTTAVNFRNMAQPIRNLASSFAATTGTSVQTISLNGTDQGGTVLTINQTANTTFGVGVVPSLISTIVGPGSIVLAGRRDRV